MPGCLLKIRDLTVRFGKSAQPVVNGITFDIDEGQIVALLGESGAGKTTLARALVRSLLPSAHISGRISIGDVDVLNGPSTGLSQISLIPQAPELALNPVMRIGKHVDEVLRVHLPVPEHRRLLTLKHLRMVDLPADIALAYPHQLSGGQRQRAVIAQALASKPVLLIADEPASALDTVIQAELQRRLRQIVSDGKTTVLFITHDPTTLVGFADVVFVMHEGRLVESGSIASMLKSPRHFYTARLVESILPLPVGPLDDAQKNDIRTDAAPAVIEVRNIRKTYSARNGPFRRGRSVDALRGVNLRLTVGSALALVGRSGSGKSTLARCLAFLEYPDAGEIAYCGKPVNARVHREVRRVRSNVQLIWQHSALSLNPRLRALDIVAEPLLVSGQASRAHARERALELVTMLGLSKSFAERRPYELSGGQRQRLALARSLMLLPSVLILDEPFAGLDLPLQKEMVELLLDLKGRFSLSYLFITHDLRAAAAIADEIAVMHEGRIVEHGRPFDLLRQPQAVATRDLVSAATLVQ